MPGLRQVVETRPVLVQDIELAVIVLEMEVEVLPEGLHIRVVTEPVGDHAPVEPLELANGGDEQEEEGVRVPDPVPSNAAAAPTR